MTTHSPGASAPYVPDPLVIIQAIDRLAQTAFSEIQSIANLARHRLMKPDRHADIDIFVALAIIADKANEAADAISVEAECLGCHYQHEEMSRFIAQRENP
ncbi:MAG: hypothetical protein LBU45_00055 [Azoarcus sp.]|nr:hypothetical protein [Azoarcus sp.]